LPKLASLGLVCLSLWITFVILSFLSARTMRIDDQNRKQLVKAEKYHA
jgi:hypothetical protein